MALKTYAPDSVVINFAGAILTGYAEGSFITVERETDGFNKVTGADGLTTRVKSANRSGSVTLTLAQSSDANAILSALQIADDLTRGGVFPLLVKDVSGNSLFTAEQAWIRKSANAEFSSDFTGRQWVIDCAEISMLHGGNNT